MGNADSIEGLLEKLENHALYSELRDLKSLRVFMETHVFAAWGFMSLLKSLQTRVTSVAVPWRPSAHPEALVRLINEIVLKEESDLDQNGEPESHLRLYLRAMKEIGANDEIFRNYVKTGDNVLLPPETREFADFDLYLARRAPLHRTAGAFFYGRLKATPRLFRKIQNVLAENEPLCPTFADYLRRHVGSEEEGREDLAENRLELLCGGYRTREREALAAAREALELRLRLWDGILERIKGKSGSTPRWSGVLPEIVIASSPGYFKH